MRKTLFVLLAFFAAALPSALAEKTAAPIPLEQIREFSDIYAAIKNYYVDETEDAKLFEKAISGLVSGLDPHSSFLNESDLAEMKELTQGEFGGLGMEVGMDATGVLVISPIDDTPAQKAGVLAGDIIIKIDGEATSGLTLNENVKRLRGKPGTKVELVIARKGTDAPLTFHLVRDTIRIQSVKSHLVEKDYLYVRISQFQERTANDLAQAVTEAFAKAPLKGVVLDLRNNPGGLLNAAIGVSAVFLPKDVSVVSTRGKNGAKIEDFRTLPQDYLWGDAKDRVAEVPEAAKKVPLAVIINAASASASEIVSGALQDHGRAVIFGNRSFGKGSVQTILPLRRQSQKAPQIGIKITTARYFTPSGRTIQAKGITPDVALWDTQKGNFASFDIREEDLAGHLTAENVGKAAKEAKREAKPSAKKSAPEVKDVKARYKFGSDADFQLKEVLRHFQGEKLLTAAK